MYAQALSLRVQLHAIAFHAFTVMKQKDFSSLYGSRAKALEDMQLGHCQLKLVAGATAGVASQAVGSFSLSVGELAEALTAQGLLVDGCDLAALITESKQPPDQGLQLLAAKNLMALTEEATKLSGAGGSSAVGAGAGSGAPFTYVEPSWQQQQAGLSAVQWDIGSTSAHGLLAQSPTASRWNFLARFALSQPKALLCALGYTGQLQQWPRSLAEPLWAKILVTHLIAGDLDSACDVAISLLYAAILRDAAEEEDLTQQGLAQRGLRVRAREQQQPHARLLEIPYNLIDELYARITGGGGGGGGGGGRGRLSPKAHRLKAFLKRLLRNRVVQAST